MTTRTLETNQVPYAVMFLAERFQGLADALGRELGDLLAWQAGNPDPQKARQAVVMIEPFPTTTSLLSSPFPVPTWPEPYRLIVNSPGNSPTSGRVYHARRPGKDSPVHLEPLRYGPTEHAGS